MRRNSGNAGQVRALPGRGTWLGAVTAVALGSAGTGGAGAFCDDLTGFMQAERGAARIALPMAGAADPACGSGRMMSGASSAHCYWSFDYRSDPAQHSFDATLSQVSACLGGGGATRVERSVNHPDSYELHAFDWAGGTLYVSLKDKAALQQTLVFLRAERTPSGD